MTPDRFALFAQPWWVNLFILVPFLCFLAWRRGGLAISRHILIYSALFGLAFGFVEASVVVYLRAAVGMLPGFNGTLADVVRESAPLYRQPIAVHQMSQALISIETLRESATIIMLVTVAMLAVHKRRERWAIFLWCFAWWDLAYYAGLWAIVRWPQSMESPDVLFLIPEPWLAQVWFPIVISGLTALAVARASARRAENLAFSASAVAGGRSQMPADAKPTRND